MIKEFLAFKKEIEKGIDCENLPIYENVEEILDVPYHSFDGYQLHLDVFKPKNVEVKIPVAIVIHGGGFVKGNPRMELPFCKELCEKGVLTYSIGYRLLNDDNNVFDLIRDVISGFDAVLNSIDQYNGDINSMYLISESAGAYLAIYADMFNKMDIFSKWFEYQPSTIRFKGNLFVSGMFYANRKDAPGLLYYRKLYKKYGRNAELMLLMNPDNPLIIRNIEDAVIITCDNDFLKRYSFDYHRHLKLAHKATKFIYYDKNDLLCHAFLMMKPCMTESKETLDNVLDYFGI